MGSSVEPDSVPAPGEYDSFTPPSAPVPEGVDDPVLLPSSEPAAIDIPAIGVHSEMQQVGLTAEHTLEVPAPGPYYDQAAWYKHSATPGAVGPAIIVGHVDSAADGPSVFFDLGNLRPGDEVLVTRRDGTVATFEVEAVRQYSKDDFPTELVYGDTDHAALRLITCGGTFDRAERSYRDNIVVFATLVGSHQDSPSS
ncbi:MAG TPA: class F sortase [Acidimicrobiia bacterium]|nr:class F sortase [Acidimicrobiia bacterium]